LKFVLDSVSYKYHPHASFCLNNVNLAVDSGRVTGLAGANGSGKTTLIRIMLRQLVDYQGGYSIDGEAVNDIAANLCSKYRIGYSPDIPVLDDVLTGYEILGIVGQVRGLTRQETEDHIVRLSSLLDLGQWFRVQQCGEYSHGMRKKVSIALAYLGPVRFVILDEPLNGLDPVAVMAVRTLIEQKRGDGVGTLVSSHILDFIEQCADSCVLMKQGTLIYNGGLQALRTVHGNQRLDEIYLSLFHADVKR
jgi:ABC-type multidrug transport system ATPase subunit